MLDDDDQAEPAARLPERGAGRRRRRQPRRKLDSLWRDRDIRRILGDNLRAKWKTYLVAVLAMAIVAGTTAGVAFVMRDIIDAITLPERRDSVGLVAAAVAGIFILRGLASYVQVVMMSKAGLSIVARQQSRIYDRLLGQGISYFTAQESAHLVLRVTHGAAAARAITDTVLTSYVRDLLSVAGLVAVMIYQQPFLSVIALAIAPFAMLGVRGLLRRSRRMAEQELTSTGEIIRIMQETAAGVRVIKAFSLEGRMARRMDRAIADVRKRALSFVRLNALTSPMMDTLSGLAIAAIVALSAVEFLGLGNSTPGALMSFISAMLMAYEPAKRVLRTRLQIERNLTAVARMFELLDAPPTMTEAPDATPLPDGPGDIRFEDVSFGFGAGPVLRHVTHTFEAGRTTALVGPSGGGKTTMMNLILRLYDPTSGAVRIDGADLRGATLASIRGKMAFVSQDTFLFSASVMENLRIGRPDAPDEAVIAAARVAQAHDFIMALPDGYDTQIGENGARLSGGQKQRLAIARAVVRGAPILLLDEATSALDAASEALVRDALHDITRGRTAIVIAHRLSTILTADRICYVEGGEIRDSGTLQELLARDGGFRRLYDQQFRHALGGGDPA